MLTDNNLAVKSWWLASLAFLAQCNAPEQAQAECENRASFAIVNGSAVADILSVSAGQRAAIGRVWPQNAPSGYFCTGVLIAPDWVLTARHCDFGSGFIFDVPGEAGNPAAMLKSHTVSPSTVHDALLFAIPNAESALPISASVEPVTRQLVGSPVQLAGYGQTEEGEPSSELRFISQLVRDVTDERIVVDGYGRAGACLGDSGGPLLLRGREGNLVVAGVLSAGDASCVGEDTYIRVDVLREWISETIGHQSSSTREACGRIDSVGICRGGNAIWCDRGFVTGDLCSAGDICGWNGELGGYRCIPASADPCRGAGDLGHCEGGAIVRCERGVLSSKQCCDGQCAWNPTWATLECYREP